MSVNNDASGLGPDAYITITFQDQAETTVFHPAPHLQTAKPTKWGQGSFQTHIASSEFWFHTEAGISLAADGQISELSAYPWKFPLAPGLQRKPVGIFFYFIVFYFLLNSGLFLFNAEQGLAAKSSRVMLGYCCVWKIKSLSLNQSDQFQAGAKRVSVDQLPVDQGWTCLGRGEGRHPRRHRHKVRYYSALGMGLLSSQTPLGSPANLQRRRVLCP